MVRGVTGSERGRKEAREGSGWPYIEGGEVYRGSCAGELLAVAGGHGGARGRVWGVRGVGLGREEGREGAVKGRVPRV